MIPLNQETLDYTNEAQMRVAVATRCLQKSFTLQLIVGQQEYALPKDVVEVLAVNDGALASFAMTIDQALSSLSQGPDPTADFNHYVIGRRIGFVPLPDSTDILTVWYTARPAPLTSSQDFELGLDYERAIEHVMLSMKLDDDGQTELSQAEEAWYVAELKALRRRGHHAQPQRLAVAGWTQDGPL